MLCGNPSYWAVKEPYVNLRFRVQGYHYNGTISCAICPQLPSPGLDKRRRNGKTSLHSFCEHLQSFCAVYSGTLGRFQVPVPGSPGLFEAGLTLETSQREVYQG